jgi:hypothetical protein
VCVLLRQPHGFEGLRPLAKIFEPSDLAIPERRHDGGRNGAYSDRPTASRAAALSSWS